jgi:hypothetical protein
MPMVSVLIYRVNRMERSAPSIVKSALNAFFIKGFLRG